MDQEIDTIEQSFEEIPEEVKAYIYSSSFTKPFQALCLSESLSQEEAEKLKISLYSYISQIETEEDLLIAINSISKNIESNQKMIDWVRENVIEKILTLVTEAYVNEEGGEESEGTSTETLPSPSKMSLSSIQERLSQNTTITPIKRDYSIEKIPEATPTPSPTAVSDPYREMPQE